MHRFLKTLGGCAALLSTAALAATQPAPRESWGDRPMPPLYSWSGEIPATPGKTLRHEPLPAELNVWEGGPAERFLYVSSDFKTNAPITVSAMVIFPKGKPPPGGWPVMAWAHGTTGTSDACAPSNIRRTARDELFFGAWLRKGYAIVATDYPGLGTPGPHPYLLWRSEGMAVLDSVRAALATYKGKLRNNVVAVGFSQGTAAALAAGWLQPEYAPDVKLKGVVASGMVANIADVHGAPQEQKPPEWTGDSYEVAAYMMLVMTGMWTAIDPELKPEDYLTEKGKPLYKVARDQCLYDTMWAGKKAGNNSGNSFKPEMDKLYALEKPYYDIPTGKIDVPVFVNTGLADYSAGTVSAYNVSSAMCAWGTTVDWAYYPRDSHLSALARSIPDSLAFADKVTTGKPVASRCKALVPPGPLQVPDE